MWKTELGSSIRDLLFFFGILFVFAFGPWTVHATPLGSHNMHPLYTPIVQFSVMGAETAEEGELRFETLQSYGNNFFFYPEDEDGDIVSDLDSEVYYSSNRFRYGITSRFELNADLRTAAHYGGVLDGFLQWYHHLFGFPNAGRGERKDYKVNFYLEDGDGIILEDDTPLFALTALQLEPRYELIHTSVSSLTVGALLKIPGISASHSLTGASLSSGKTDVALRIFYDHSFDSFILYGASGIAYLSTPPYLSDLSERYFRHFIVPFTATLEWKAGPKFSAVVTVHGNSSPFDIGYYRSDKHSSVVTFGGEFRPSERSAFQLSMSQEFFTFAATDVALNFSWERSFDPSEW